MAEYADALIAVWDGESRGTMHMIDIARERGLTVAAFIFDQERRSLTVRRVEERTPPPMQPRLF